MESVHEPCEYTNNTEEKHAAHQLETHAPGETDGGRDEKKKKCWRWPFGPGETDGGRKEAGNQEKRNLVNNKTGKKLTRAAAGTSRRHDKGYILRRYKIGPKLGEGGFGLVTAGSRRKDGLEVAVKYSLKSPNMPFIRLPGHPKRLTWEIGLTLMANKSPSSPQIIKLLDWQEYTGHYIMVMERPLPSMDLLSFMELHGGTLNEGTAQHVMRQVVRAANVCFDNGVFHRDIKPENLLVNQDTMEVKLIDFGCGALMKEAAFKVFCGTKEYFPPEFKLTGKYHAKPMTVWSLGILLFEMLCGDFPTAKDLCMTAANIWTNPGLSQECCRLICDCLQSEPKKRLALEMMHLHDWFKVMD
ncbi:serine/threonine-protein kinase pim-2-like [Carassius gibelio]|uniref:serine/threonine-protein kinase pim-2-like n=1 Tax=Carassius gibelio TaxID=101364 RepID=UPI0022785E0D|nr:serine/threonine-protein kinase pim-2-like [Carassius gibelio]